MGRRNASLLTLAFAAMVACERTAETTLPPVPDADLSLFEPAVREQLAAARRALDARAVSPELNGRLGMILHAYGWLEQARSCYRRAALLDTGAFRWWYCLARVELQSGEGSEACNALQRAVILKGDYLPALLLLGEIRLKEGNLDEARKWFTRTFEVLPRSPHALLGLGQVESRSGNAALATQRFQEALKIAPQFGAASYNLALAYRAAGDREKAQLLLSQHAAEDGPLPPDEILEEIQALRRDADHILRSANSLFKEEKYAEAIPLYQEVLKLNPELEMAEYNIGLALQRLEKPELAMTYYRSLLRRRPESPEALNNLGLCFYELDRDGEAIEYFEKAIAVDPRFHKAHFNLGLTQGRKGQLDQAAEHFHTVLFLRPDDPEAHFNLGLLSQRTGKKEDATGHFLQALQARPDDDRIHRQLREEVGGAGGAACRRLAAFLKGQRLFKAAFHALRQGLREAPADWRTTIALAWMLSTCPDATLRQAQEAVRLAEPICRDLAGGDPVALDSLAAAYAAAGRFDEARETAAAAVRLCEAQPASPATTRLPAEIKARLELYCERKPYHEE